MRGLSSVLLSVWGWEIFVEKNLVANVIILVKRVKALQI